MINFNKRNINLITLTITTAIFIPLAVMIHSKNDNKLCTTKVENSNEIIVSSKQDINNILTATGSNTGGIVEKENAINNNINNVQDKSNANNSQNKNKENTPDSSQNKDRENTPDSSQNKDRENTPNSSQNKENTSDNSQNKEQKDKSTNNSSSEPDNKPSQNNDNQNWTVKIPKLNITAPIEEIEGIVPSEKAVGHFNITTTNGNNIGLIAYNFGKEKNYFANLKELKVGDKIIYNINNQTRTYKVIYNKIIERSELENAIKEENRRNNHIKLFTYVIDLNNKIRYVYAKEAIKT